MQVWGGPEGNYVTVHFLRSTKKVQLVSVTAFSVTGISLKKVAGNLTIQKLRCKYRYICVSMYDLGFVFDLVHSNITE